MFEPEITVSELNKDERPPTGKSHWVTKKREKENHT